MSARSDVPSSLSSKTKISSFFWGHLSFDIEENSREKVFRSL
jgi:hypothetical protein